MSSAKAKSKEQSYKGRTSKAIAPQLSIPGRKSKDRSAHLIGQVNFQRPGEYYAFHDSLLKLKSKNRKLRSSRAQKNSSEEDSKVKSENDAFAEAKMEDLEMDNLSSPPTYEVDPDVLIPEARPETPVLPQVQDDPQQEIKPNESVDNDDFIPISPVIQSIDESLSELIAIQTVLTKLVRKRRHSIKRGKTGQRVVLVPKKSQSAIIRQEKKTRTAISAEPKPIEIQEKKQASRPSTDPSSMMSTNYEESLNITDFSDNDFDFPTEDDFMAYNGSPNDPMPIIDAPDLIEFTSPSVATGVQNGQMSALSEILVQAAFSCTPPFSCVRKTDSAPEESSLDTLLAIKSEPAPDEASWNSFHEPEYLHSTLVDTQGDTNMEGVDDWLNLTTNEVLPDDLEIR